MKKEMIKQNKTENKQEKIFQTIRGVRFEKGIPQKEIDKFFKKYEKVPLKGDLKKILKTDDLTYFEHRAICSTVTGVVDPLTPFSILAENKTPEELSESRKRSVGVYGVYSFDEKGDTFFREKDVGRGNIGLNIPSKIKKKVLEIFKKNKNEYFNGLWCEFNKPKVDSKTGKIIMPTLKSISANAGQENLLGDDLTSQIMLKEMLFEESALEKDRNTLKYFIDKNGWRIEK
jgi:hypothetical protein